MLQTGNPTTCKRRFAVSTLMLAMYAPALLAQEGEPASGGAAGGGLDIAPPMEEVVVLGRALSTAAQLTEERLNDEVVANILGAEDISRLGDSTVAVALRRISGLTLVQDSFVYVRGLGERYSSTTLNGARVPSPDLTRSVIPLDIFPSAVVESLKVQKSYSADKRATFGGGNIDIRTKGIPDGFVFGLEVGTAYNNENDSTGLTYAGGGDDWLGVDDGTRKLPNELRDAIAQYRGNISSSAILSDLRGSDPDATLGEAQAINRELALLLNRNISIRETDIGPDQNLRGYIGTSFFVGDYLEAGFLMGGQYQQRWRETTQIRRNIGRPTEQTDTEEETTRSVNITGNANFGIRWGEEHEVGFKGLFLRNTDDETARRTFFNANREVSGGSGFQNFRLQWEERDIEVLQLNGEHRIGQFTKDTVEEFAGFLTPLFRFIPEDTEITWYASDSTARTNIPNQVETQGEGRADADGFIPTSTVRIRSNAGDFRFTDLEDEVQDSGIAVNLPFYFDAGTFDLTFGFASNRQARVYEQIQFTLGPISVGNTDVVAGPLGDVFSDGNVTSTDNNFAFERTGTNSESYVAATITDSAFVKFDTILWEHWRLSAGVRNETYRQVGLDYNPFGFGAANPIITNDTDVLLSRTFYEDDVYPSVSLTYMDDWLAETFQLRVGYSQTATRPDLREITDASYVDPLTNDIVNGNPDVTPSSVRNFDVRAEWFFSNGDNFTVSLYYKDIDQPIEFFEAAASDTSVAREIVNADSAEIYGVEIEFLKELSLLGDFFSQFFIQGNVTLQESELIVGSRADAPTNLERPMVNASPWVTNLQLGYDSPNGAHTATLALNAYEERLFVAGRNGAPDGYEQPFSSLDLTYQYYPTDNITVRAKIQNILGDNIEIERAGVIAFEQDIGQTFTVSVRWDM